MTLSTGIALSPIWLRGEAWRRDDSRVEEMFSLTPYAELARKAEAAALDFLFCPEAGYLRPDSVGGAPGFTTLDSFTLVTALAAITTRIGLVPTVQTAYAHPSPGRWPPCSRSAGDVPGGTWSPPWGVRKTTDWTHPLDPRSDTPEPASSLKS